jgi:hypothetical protein
MRRTGIAVLGVVSIAVGVAGPLLAAGTVNLDLSDFDDDVMRGMDDTLKSLDSGIATKDAQSVARDSQSIQKGLAWAQDYFVKKGSPKDAVQWAREGQELAEAINKSVQASDFDTSLNKYDALVKTCRACHDVYKPPDI